MIIDTDAHDSIDDYLQFAFEVMGASVRHYNRHAYSIAKFA